MHNIAPYGSPKQLQCAGSGSSDQVIVCKMGLLSIERYLFLVINPTLRLGKVTLVAVGYCLLHIISQWFCTSQIGPIALLSSESLSEESL